MGPFPAWPCRSFPRTHGRTTPLRKTGKLDRRRRQAPNRQANEPGSSPPKDTNLRRLCAFPHCATTTHAQCLPPLSDFWAVLSATGLLRSTSSFDLSLPPSHSILLLFFFCPPLNLQVLVNLSPTPSDCWHSAQITAVLRNRAINDSRPFSSHRRTLADPLLSWASRPRPNSFESPFSFCLS